MRGPVTFRDIEEATGVSHNGVAQVITTLSLKYPIWSPKRGVYKLYDDDDYNSNGRRGMTGKHVFHDITELVSILQKKELPSREITAIQNKHETLVKWNHNNFSQLLDYISNQYSIYESNYRLYKILTDEDIEKYREELRKNGKQRNDLA